MISLPIMHDPTKSYRGRFAPSPTGPLHFGSLVAAVGSRLDAGTRGGKWFVRMEDLDPPREAPGAARAILRTLEAYGFEWDGKVVFQSRRGAAYSEALARLEAEPMIPEVRVLVEFIRSARRGVVLRRASRHHITDEA